MPALIDGHKPNNVKRNCYCYLWNLEVWIVIFADIAKTEYQNSRNIFESLTKVQLEQSNEY